jgi:hypothetical protein
VNDLTYRAIRAIQKLHDFECSKESHKDCFQHNNLILGLKNQDLVLENQIRSRIAKDLSEARDFMVETKEPESGTAAMWITYAFDRAIGFTKGQE